MDSQYWGRAARLLRAATLPLTLGITGLALYQIASAAGMSVNGTAIVLGLTLVAMFFSSVWAIWKVLRS
jgi:hypothetical protein